MCGCDMLGGYEEAGPEDRDRPEQTDALTRDDRAEEAAEEAFSRVSSGCCWASSRAPARSGR